MKTIKVESYGEIPNGFTGIAEYVDGSKKWYLNGKRHRVDGPAIEYAYGEKEWYLDGERHRVDGPAIEWVDGTKQWFLNGKLHRVDGPAKECADGTKVWWLNGERHRVDGPAIEYAYGTKVWWLNDFWIFTLKPLGDYIVIEDGLPSATEWLGKPMPTLKVLTAEGIQFIPNLPGI